MCIRDAYKGPRDVVVKKVPDAKIEKATDVLVKITTTNICGSVLHMYEGRTGMEPGRIFGHENLGTVIEIGSAVDRVKLCLLYTSPSPRDRTRSRMPSSA